MTIRGVHFDSMAIILIGAAIVWLAMLVAALVTRVRDEGIRGVEILLMFASFALAGTWQYTMYKRAPKQEVNIASARTCGTVETGSRDEDVRKKLGNPDHVRSEEDVRGPGAEVWLYDDSRCAVHIMMDTVEYIE